MRNAKRKAPREGSTANVDAIELVHRGRRAIVERNSGHPENYLWIRVDGALYFLGVLVTA
jgi:hypothetical protein